MGEDLAKSLLTYGPLGAFVILLCSAVALLWRQINALWAARYEDNKVVLEMVGKASAIMAVVSEVSKATQADTARVADAVQALTAGVKAIQEELERMGERQDERFDRVEKLVSPVERAR